MARDIDYILNSENITLDAHCSDMLVDILRKDLGLKGTKEVCKEGDCGACSVLIGEYSSSDILRYKNLNSCIYHKSLLNAKHIVTIEGLRLDKGLSFVQKMFYDEGATQCGYCTPGFIISATCYFLELTNRKLNSFDFEYSKLVEYVSGNICRCTGHISIKRSLHNMLRKFYDKYKSEKITIDTLVKEEIIPCYFSDIKIRLKALQQTNLIMSGGTDLYVQNMHHTGGIELKSYKRTDTSLIYDSGGEIVISAFATVTDLCNSNLILKYFPEIPTYRELFGSVQIRNKATAGGNIINASPIGDTVNILMALDAALVLTSEHGERILPLRKFYTGYKTNVSQKDETLTEIRIKIPKGRYIFSYEKVSKRMHLDIASVNSTMYMEYEGNRIIKASISAGGVAPCPVYLENTSEYLKGKEISQDTFSEIENIIQSEISPINDVRGSATYKRLLLGRLVKMHFIKYFPELAEVII